MVELLYNSGKLTCARVHGSQVFPSKIVVTYLPYLIPYVLPIHIGCAIDFKKLLCITNIFKRFMENKKPQSLTLTGSGACDQC